MLRLTLAQMRRSLGRLTAAAVAITIGTAFVAATLLAGNAMTRTTYDAVSSQYGGADLVVSEGEVTDRTLAVLTEVPGVTSVHGYRETAVEVAGPSGQTVTPVTAPPQDRTLSGTTMVEGSQPTGPDDIALPPKVAELLGVDVGDTVRVTQTVYVVDSADAEPEVLSEDLTVVGLVDAPGAAFLGTGGVSLVHPERLDTWMDLQDPESTTSWFWYALVSVSPDASLTQVQDSAHEAIGASAEVRTLDEQARATTEQITGSADQLTVVVLGFAAVALLVAALVIANTFQVLVAQRTRTLALLRCVGADRSQLRRSVVLEALILGGTASVAGLLLGTAVVQAALLVLGETATDVPLPTTVSITPLVVLVPLALGVLVTVLAALSPARAATRVSPLAALRPADAPRTSERSGRVRAWLAGVLMVGGGLGLVAGLVASRDDLMVGLGFGVLGGAVSFVGVVLGAVFWVPRLVGLAGSVLGRRGTAARLAAANSVRNPQRTAATSAALFIGVTLVAMMATGAASTRTALDKTLSEEFPVDVAVGTLGDGSDSLGLPAGLRSTVDGLNGVTAVAGLTGLVVDVADGQGAVSEWVTVRGIDAADASSVVRASEQVDGLGDGTVLVPKEVASWTGIEDGDELVLTQVSPPEEGAAEAAPATGSVALEVTAVLTDLPGQALVVTRSSLATLDPGAPVTRLWIRLDDDGSSTDAVTAITAASSETGTPLETTGAAVERDFYQRVVNTLLAVVVGLLAVAVVIALVGVTNTLSLSVIERRRESATLRAIGLSRRQLRATLAIEGVLIAGVGAVVGALLGTVYGWAGAQTLLGQLSPVALTIPWRDLGLVVAVALVAGLLASVLPGRSAARTSPVEALAVE